MPIEEQLLPSPELKPYYTKVTWLFVCRKFDDSPADREALRTHDRFGVSSWPQMFLFDPRTDRVLRESPRDLAGFEAVFDAVLADWHRDATAYLAGRTLAGQLAQARAAHQHGEREAAFATLQALAAQRDPFDGWLEARELLREWRGERRPPDERLDDPDPRQRALALEGLAAATAAPADVLERVRALLLDDGEDMVVRSRAFRYLAKADPKSIPPHAERLLALPNDPFRYEVLTVLQQRPAPDLVPVLVRLFEGAGTSIESRNPNVLRIRAAACLGTIGDASAIDALAPAARACDPTNGLTSTVFGALVAIGQRAGAADRARVLALLIESLPQPAVAGNERRCLALARLIVEGVAKVSGATNAALPARWTADDRESLAAKLRASARER